MRGPTHRPGLTYTLLLLSLGAEVGFIYCFSIRPFAWIYPQGFDQVQYLTEAYQAYEYKRVHGFMAALLYTITNGSAQGTLHDCWALLIFSVIGPGRAQALALNLLALAAWQAATFFTVRKLLRRSDLAWMAIAMEVTSAFPWSGNAGSMADFRLDWMAACTYGIALNAALVAWQIRSYRWSFLSGVTIALVLLTRFLTGVYFGLSSVAILLWLITNRGRHPYIIKFASSLLAAGGLAFPIFYINRQYIYHYYWVGHVAGPERLLRDSHMNFAASFRWVAESIFKYDLGYPLCIGAGVIYLIYYYFSRSQTGQSTPVGGAQMVPSGGHGVIISAYLFAPALVLLFHPVKAQPPLAIVIAPAIWPILFLWDGASRHLRSTPRRHLAGASLGAALLLILLRVARPPFPLPVYDDAKAVNALTDYLVFRSDAGGLTAPRVGATLTSEILDAGALNVLAYERHGYWPGFIQTLPSGLFDISQGSLITALGESDFILLLERPAISFPFDRDAMASIQVMRTWCHDHATEVGQFTRGSEQVKIFERGLKSLPPGMTLPSLTKMLEEYAHQRGNQEVLPPAAPVLAGETHLLLPTGRPFIEKLEAVFRPVAFATSQLPPGLALTPEGILKGVLSPGPPTVVPIHVTNARGSTDARWLLLPSSEKFSVAVWCPPTAPSDAPFSLECAAVDSLGQLNFVDITDQSEAKLLARLETPLGSLDTWHQRAGFTLHQPGIHHLSFRFVRFNPQLKQYLFVDRNIDIEVTP